MGVTGDITVILEDPVDEMTGIPNKTVQFLGVQAGTFLPIKALTVTVWGGSLDDIVAMY